MELKSMIAVIGLLIVTAGVVMAISGATPTAGTQTRWSGSTGLSSVTTQGGNLTNVNISATTLTTKWADFYGNVTGTVVLGNASTYVYTWTYPANTTTGARVCLTTNSSWITTVVPFTATGANIDTVWAFSSSDADCGANTYATTNCSLNLSGGTVSPTGNVSLEGSSTFTDCVISNGGTAAAAAYGNYAFCTNTNRIGTNYAGTAYNYEVMVPVTKTGTQAYYFYAELG